LISGSAQHVESEIESLLSISRKNNAAYDITGALLFNGDAFAQILEGPRSAVESVYAKICVDSRNQDVILLENGQVPERVFMNWAMAYSDVETASSTFGGLNFDSILIDPRGRASEMVFLLQTLVNTYSGDEMPDS
jgi:hypothetical protein